MDYAKLIAHLKNDLNFQSYGLEEGFREFEREAVSCLDRVEREPFEWRDNNGDDVTVYISIDFDAVAVDEEDVPCEFQACYTVHDHQFV